MRYIITTCIKLSAAISTKKINSICVPLDCSSIKGSEKELTQNSSVW